MENKTIRIALAGNPNCGKTTLFNALTGSNQFVGNWPGVTVEKKEGKLKKHDDYWVSDQFSNYYANFIKTGNPNGLGLVSWPATNGDRKSVV